MTLELRNVTKKFGAFTAVNDISLTIPKGEMFGMLGANGAGKTTTFRMILGLIDQTDGKISWKGNKIGYQSSHLVGYLPEERGLYPKMKVSDQLVYLGRLRGMKKGQVLIELKKWLDRFNIPDYIDKKIDELSKGNQQKIQFIASVIHQPELLILDEPFSGLDPVNVEQLKKAVLDLKNEGTTIVFSSHRMEHVEELCEYLCILQKGEPVVNGPLKEVKRSYGKKKVTVEAEFELSYLQDIEGVTSCTLYSGGARLVITREEVADDVFKALSGRGSVRKFVLEEPSLNDIFIEKVGASYE
ncbi:MULTISPECIES: ABC transporter ATP-binding protein [Alteribacter]|uniref:ATP-binding cassette domain-containing protein n=1 Tax=Alteribacter keqinensis TaxID=2483800 RepID=A0A3M7TY47_9BACI|nr:MULTISPECIES: ABC transporter ATP-binding protein [Alteribacter]MBM7097365.1 ABC transporter ATP-binding protein [Alteribacter salitolerans]RNA70540.1 ATP-binding cassette domain-containing protein [Alteribacter keqinensis]